MFHRITSVAALDNLELSVSFFDGERKIYDVKPLFDKWRMFKSLLDKELFNSVRVDAGGYGVVWNDNLDLSCDELWHNGREIEDPFNSRAASPNVF